MTRDYAYQIAAWICNNRADLALLLKRFKQYAKEPELKLIFNCVNKQKNRIDITQLNRYFPK